MMISLLYCMIDIYFFNFFYFLYAYTYLRHTIPFEASISFFQNDSMLPFSEFCVSNPSVDRG